MFLYTASPFVLPPFLKYLLTTGHKIVITMNKANTIEMGLLKKYENILIYIDFQKIEEIVVKIID